MPCKGTENSRLYSVSYTALEPQETVDSIQVSYTALGTTGCCIPGLQMPPGRMVAQLARNLLREFIPRNTTRRTSVTQSPHLELHEPDVITYITMGLGRIALHFQELPVPSSQLMSLSSKGEKLLARGIEPRHRRLRSVGTHSNGDVKTRVKVRR